MHELVSHLHAERDAARTECDEHMTGKGRVQQRLSDAEIIMNYLARSAEPSEPPTPCDRPERIADPDCFDGTRDKLKVFKDQLLQKTSGNPSCFPNVQHKLRYAYQFLTGKAQWTTPRGTKC